MKKQDVVDLILQDRHKTPQQEIVSAYAPSNIALCKYWGKRNEVLNLPVTSSLSISLANKGTTTVLKLNDGDEDRIVFNGRVIETEASFATRASEFLDLFRQPGQSFLIETQSNIPVAAGFASSASGYAALVEALNLLFDWQLPDEKLSILARLGSGSASRSLWHGFVEWQCGSAADGMDSFAKPLDVVWPEFCVGLLVLNPEEKSIGSRDAMKRCKESSCYYPLWPEKVSEDLKKIHHAIVQKDMTLLGKTAQSNALAMHATAITAEPVVCYWQPETIAAMQEVWQLQKEGLSVYFTEDAGPNLKLLFEEKDAKTVKAKFPLMEIVMPFA